MDASAIVHDDASGGADGGARDAPQGDGDASEPPVPIGDGHIAFRIGQAWYRVTATAGATRENLSVPMDSVSRGNDSFLGLSKDGAWLVALGSRFNCASGGCLGLFTGDLAGGGAVSSGGITAGNTRAAVSSAGGVIVFSAPGEHALDLYAVKRTGPASAWGAPVLLTRDSPFPYHHDAAIRFDGSRAVFDCGDDPYGAPPTSVCEVGTDGADFHEVIKPSDGPDHGASHAVHHPDYTPAGDYVFEADWPSETVWKLVRGASAPVRISPEDQTDDNSPCVLPDGRIASLWMGRPGNPSAHELKVMSADGSSYVMLVTGEDVVDIGISCGN